MSRTRRLCVITGASGGLGRSLAFAFSGAGFHAVLTGRDLGALEALARELDGGAGATAIAADLGEPEHVLRLGAETEALSGRVEVLVANAGQALGNSFITPEDSLERWREMVLVNVYGAAAVARIFLPTLIDARGSLFFIGSVAGRTVYPGDLYSVTKHAVSAIAEAIRAETQLLGVQVCIVQPGLLDTPLVSDARRSQPLLDPDDVAAEIVRAAAPKRRFDVNELMLRPRRHGR